VIADRYGLTVMELPAILAHSKDLRFDNNHTKAQGFTLNRVSWGN